ncbi:MAG: hypothetical protein Q4C70_14540 [Planctomycetia bacterium]|nr:hypothetical protein [Planctomycetia bacterium]
MASIFNNKKSGFGVEIYVGAKRHRFYVHSLGWSPYTVGNDVPTVEAL